MAFEDLLVKIVSRLDSAGFKELDRMESKASKATSVLSNNLRNMFIGVVGTIGAKEIIDASVKLDSLRTSFAALAGSDVGGAEQLKYLREETNRLGQDFVSSAEAYKNLFSAGTGAGMAAEEIQKVFSSVMEAGTVLGSSQQQMQGALMALEQMISKGKVSMEELRRQLGNALPGAMQIAAKAMGTTSAGLQEMLEAGLDSQKFVTRFSAQLHEEFGGKAVEASHTLRAELQRLQNALFDVKASFLDGEAGEAFADVIKQLTDVLKNPEFIQALSNIGTASAKGLKIIMDNKDIIKDLVVVFVGGKLISGILKVGAGAAKLTLQATKFIKVVARAIKIFGGGRAILMVLSRLGLAAIPIIGDIALAIMLVVDAVKLLFRWLNKLKEEKKLPGWAEKILNFFGGEKDKSPKFVQGEDGIMYDTNPNSDTYFDPNTFKAYKFNPRMSQTLTGGAAPLGYSGTLPDLSNNLSQNTNTNNISINISTNSDNPQGIGEAVRTAMLDVFESVRIRNGYPQTEVV